MWPRIFWNILVVISIRKNNWRSGISWGSRATYGLTVITNNCLDSRHQSSCNYEHSSPGSLALWSSPRTSSPPCWRSWSPGCPGPPGCRSSLPSERESWRSLPPWSERWLAARLLWSRWNPHWVWRPAPSSWGQSWSRSWTASAAPRRRWRWRASWPHRIAT